MDQLNRQVWHRFVAIAKPYWFSEERIKARTLLFVLLLLMAAVNGLNVVINYVGGDFMTALSGKNAPKYFQLLWIYGGVFVVGTPVVVFYSWVQSKLGLHWRKWLTEYFLKKYFDNRAFYHINTNTTIDNPDERIASDVSAFTTSALSFLLTILSSIITLFSFTAILYSISTALVVTLIVYSVFGTVATIWFGKRLIGLNFNQLRKEADFRYSLVHVRKNTESIAFYQGEEKEANEIKRRFLEAFQNFNILIGWQRNLGFLTTGYNYFVVIIPSLVIAPLYFAGKVQFGVITQADLAFSQVLAALSLIVSSFDTLSAFIAQINRLGQFNEALEAPKDITVPAARIESVVETRIALENVTLLTPQFERTLVKDLTVSLAPGHGLLIAGQSGAGKSSLLRAIAGLWDTGTGKITRPELKDMFFLPQKPYMQLGTLRQQLVYPKGGDYSDEQLINVLNKVNLPELIERVGGLDAVIDWSDYLSLGEQQRLAFARVLLNPPKYVILDEATSALDAKNEEVLYKQLRLTRTTFISVGHRSSLLQYHDHVVELDGTSEWRLLGTREYAAQMPEPVFSTQLDVTTQMA